MSGVQGFWSYVHKDDVADDGRISRLARDMGAQYEMLTGEAIELFLDRDALKWGDNWRNKIDESLASVAYFIPVLTPRYFMSPECRREFQFFARRADRLGINDLVLPLLYVDVPSLADDAAKDELVLLVRRFHWEDWRETRYTDVTTEAYRRGVSSLAARLVAANMRVEQTDIVAAARRVEETDEEEDEPLGLIDRLAQAEEALPDWKNTLSAISQEIELIGRLMSEATAEINEKAGRSKGFAHRLTVARRLAKQLGEPTDKVSSFGRQFVTQLHDVDEGFRAIIAHGPAEIAERPESKTELCQFFKVVRNLSTSAQSGLSAIQQMAEAIAPVEKMSRDLRPVLRRLRQGLTMMVEAREVTDSWVGLIDESGVDCQDLPTPEKSDDTDDS